MIEGDGDEGIPFCGFCVTIEGLGQPRNELGVVEIFIPVLEADDGVEDLAIGEEAGAGPFEVPVVLGAVVADEIGGAGG